MISSCGSVGPLDRDGAAWRERQTGSAPLRVGVIGTRWGLMHVGAFREAGAVEGIPQGGSSSADAGHSERRSAIAAEVIAILGADPERTRRIARDERIPIAARSLEELLEASDLVVVASPPDLHAAQAEAALAAGRHVLVEKPITRTRDAARRLADLASAYPSLFTATSFPFRFLAPFARLCEELHAGAFGRVKAVTHEVEHGYGREAGDGDPLGASAEFNGASHLVDLAGWLLAEEFTLEDAAFPDGQGSGIRMALRSTSGIPVRLMQRAVERRGSRGRWCAETERGTIAIEAGYVPDAGGWIVTPLTRDGHELAAGVNPDPDRPGSDPWFRAHVAIARRVLDVLHGRERGPLATFADGVRAQEILCRAADRACGGGPADA